MGVGSNSMNDLVVLQSSQGLHLGGHLGTVSM